MNSSPYPMTSESHFDDSTAKNSDKNCIKENETFRFQSTGREIYG